MGRSSTVVAGQATVEKLYSRCAHARGRTKV